MSESIRKCNKCKNIKPSYEFKTKGTRIKTGEPIYASICNECTNKKRTPYTRSSIYKKIYGENKKTVWGEVL
jgi:RNase P subunit RPR2